MSALIQLTYLLCHLIEMQHIVVILTLIHVQSASKVLTQVHFHFEWYLVNKLLLAAVYWRIMPEAERRGHYPPIYQQTRTSGVYFIPFQLISTMRTYYCGKEKTISEGS